MNELGKELSTEIRAYHNPEVFLEEILEIDWLWEWQKKGFLDFYNKNYKEMVAVTGMRAGKTTLSSCFAAYELYKLLVLGKPNKYYGMPTGQDIHIINVATSATQALDTVFSQVESRIENSDWFMRQEFKKKKGEYRFKTNDCDIVVRSEHSNSSSLAGKTAKCVILDELARFTEGTSGASDAEIIYDTLNRTTQTFGDEGKMITISSPMVKDDLLMQLLRTGRNDDDVLTIHKPTWEANPNITKESLKREFKRNPEGAQRDFGAEPPASKEPYFKERERIERVIDESIPTPEYEYHVPDLEPIEEPVFLAGDPALKNDAFGIAMAYINTQKNKVDEDGTEVSYIEVPLAHCFEPRGYENAEIDAGRVVNYITNLIETHNVRMFITDIWNYPEALQKIKNRGIPVEQNHVQKAEYDTLKEKIYTEMIRMPQSKATEELKKLELKGGKRVDHPKNGSKDVADAVANAVYAATQNTNVYQEPILRTINTF